MITVCLQQSIVLISMNHMAFIQNIKMMRADVISNIKQLFIHRYYNIYNNRMQNLQMEMQMQQGEGRKIQDIPPKEMNIQIIFLMHGITSILGWFVVINSLQYFHYLYPTYDVYQFFLLLILLGYLMAIIFFKKIHSKLGFQKVVNIGLMISAASLICLLLSGLIFQQIKPLGFTLSLMSCFVLGFSSNLVQLSYFSLLNFMPEKAISRFNVGTAISGLFFTILKMIILAISGTKPRFLPILIYFCVALVVQFADFILNNRFCGSSLYLQKIKPIIQSRSLQQRLTKDNGGNGVEGVVGELSSDQKEQKSMFRQLKEVSKIIFPYPIIICSNYIITMMLFPDLTVKIKFHFNPSWSAIIFIFLFALGDTLGKILIEIKNTFNLQSNRYLIISRLAFYFIIPAMASQSQHLQDDYLLHNDVFPFVVLFVFGVSGGLVLGSSVMLIAQKCPLEYKKSAGLLTGISLQLGLTLGIIFALPMQLIAK